MLLSVALSEDPEQFYVVEHSDTARRTILPDLRMPEVAIQRADRVGFAHEGSLDHRIVVGIPRNKDVLCLVRNRDHVGNLKHLAGECLDLGPRQTMKRLQAWISENPYQFSKKCRGGNNHMRRRSQSE